MLRHVVVGCKRLSQHFVHRTDYLTNVDFDAEVHKDVTTDLETVNVCCPCGVKHVFTIDALAKVFIFGDSAENKEVMRTYQSHQSQRHNAPDSHLRTCHPSEPRALRAQRRLSLAWDCGPARRRQTTLLRFKLG